MNKIFSRINTQIWKHLLIWSVNLLQVLIPSLLFTSLLDDNFWQYLWKMILLDLFAQKSWFCWFQFLKPKKIQLMFQRHHFYLLDTGFLAVDLCQKCIQNLVKHLSWRYLRKEFLFAKSSILEAWQSFDYASLHATEIHWLLQQTRNCISYHKTLFCRKYFILGYLGFLYLGVSFWNCFAKISKLHVGTTLTILKHGY